MTFGRVLYDLLRVQYKSPLILGKWKVGLSVMLKDEAAAKKLLEDIIHLSDATPFEAKPLFESVVRLKQFGFRLEELIPMMRTLVTQVPLRRVGCKTRSITYPWFWVK